MGVEPTTKSATIDTQVKMQQKVKVLSAHILHAFPFSLVSQQRDGVQLHQILNISFTAGFTITEAVVDCGNLTRGRGRALRQQAENVQRPIARWGGCTGCRVRL